MGAPQRQTMRDGSARTGGNVIKQRQSRHASWRTVAISLLASGSVVALAAFPTSGEPPGADMAKSSSTGPGMRAYIDPATGQLAVPPASERLERSGGGAAAKEAVEGIVEVPSTGAAGGFMANTKGRFTSDVVATTDSAGRTTLECTAGAAQPGRPGCSPTK